MCSTVAAMFGLKVPNRRKYIDFRPWRYSRCLTGPESLLSPDASLVTSSTNESHRYVHDSELSWKSTTECVSPAAVKLPLLRYHSHQQSLAARQREKDKLLSRSAIHAAAAAAAATASANVGPVKGDGSTVTVTTTVSTRDLHSTERANSSSSAPSGGLVANHHPHHHHSVSPPQTSGHVPGAHLRGDSNGAHLDRRMNVNGLDRSAMTGSSSTTSENLSWLADVASSQAQTGQRPVQSILSSISAVGPSAGGSSHDHHPMLSGVQGSGLNSLFRPPPSLAADPGRALFGSNQYAPIYSTTTTSSLAAYSPSIYSGQSLSPYSAFYHHYPAGYNTAAAGALLSNYAHLDPSQPYSAALVNMGSQVQHHVPPSQLPRAFLTGPHLSQYPSSLTQTNSPGPRSMTPSLSSSQGQSSHPLSDPHRQDSKSPHKQDLRHSGDLGRRTLSPPGRESKHSSILPGGIGGAHHSVMHPKQGQSLLKDSHLHDHSGKSPSGMTGKEGSRKHRLLTRTPDPEFIEPKPLQYKSSSASVYPEEPSSKRLKGIGHPPPLHSSSHPSAHHPHHPSHHHPHYPHHHPHSHHPHHHQYPTHHHGDRGIPVSPGGHLRPHPPPLQPVGYPPSHLHYPEHFRRGSIIQLANGDLKRVEDLRTDDFVTSADVSGDLKIDSSTVVRIEENMERGTALLGFSVGEHRVQVTVEATLEHPFFVFGQGWSSCQPERTQNRYVLSCHKLSVGDVCISLTHKNVTSRAPVPDSRTQRQGSHQAVKTSSSSTSSLSSSKQISGGTSGAPATEQYNPLLSSTSATTATTGATLSSVPFSSIATGRRSSSSSTSSSPTKHLLSADSDLTSHHQKSIETDIDVVDSHSQDSPLALVPTAADGGGRGGGSRANTPDSGMSNSRKRRWSAPEQISPANSPGGASSHHQEEQDEGREGHQGNGEGQSSQSKSGGIKEETSQA